MSTASAAEDSGLEEDHAENINTVSMKIFFFFFFLFFPCCRVLDMSTAEWLKTNSLVAKKLTISDAVAAAAIPHDAKYVPMLEKHIYSKVFDEVIIVGVIMVFPIIEGQSNPVMKIT